jgi:squalene-hopene/tetraprenyl-beta-curcumene cyclase
MNSSRVFQPGRLQAEPQPTFRLILPVELSSVNAAGLCGTLRRRMHPAFQETLLRVRERLLAERGAHGHWEGELSSSALSTATAVIALALVDRARHAPLIRRGLDWLQAHANADGGWGDTVLSRSNISTTALVWAAFGMMNESAPAAETWLAAAISGQLSVVSCRSDESKHRIRLHPEDAPGQAPNIPDRTPNTEHRTFNIEHPTRLRQEASPGQASKSPASAINHPPSSIIPSALVAAIVARYGKDRTFSVPILTACALAGRVSWDQVLPLPFELAVLPHQLFRWMRLPVVSYALPALIAIGQVRHHHRPERRWLRDGARAASLRVLEQIQPANGGFLEAAPLTSFVVMSLAGMGLGAHPVAARGVQFLTASARSDGSWPIDSNLATWLTTLAVNALGSKLTTEVTEEQRGHEGTEPLCPPSASVTSVVKDWLLAQQYRAEHPFTHAAPGGWSWTDLPGGVPDADDTAGVLLALKTLTTEVTKETRGHGWEKPPCPPPTSVTSVVNSGIEWLLDLQNGDGGMPTFCRGWGALPFDRSAPDLTAHALRAFAAWREELSPALQKRVDVATQRALRFLAKAQRADGAWAPLWFGNQDVPGEENLTYGTAQVLRGLQELRDPLAAKLAVRATVWLLAAQNPDGSWAGGSQTNPASPGDFAGASIEPGFAQKATPGQAANIEHRTSNIELRSEEASPLETRPSPLDTLHLSPDPHPSTLDTSASSIEETALAVGALAGLVGAETAVARGVDWLIARTDCGRVTPAAPIGLYFARLWYFERLYPLVFLAGALERVAQCRSQATGPASRALHK